MRIILESDLFAKAHSSEEHAALLSLFVIGLERRHTVEVSSEDSPMFRDWLGARDDQTRAMCKRALDTAVKMRARRRRLSVHVTSAPDASWKEKRLSLDDATKLLRKPLKLLLENRRNEPAFLRVFSRLRRDFDLDDLMKRGIVECDGGGIDENRKWLEKNGHEPGFAFRCWVMCDSDARRAWQRPADGSVPAEVSRSAEKMAKVCARHGVRLHVLSRRFIESYLPLPAIQQWAALQPSTRDQKYVSLTRLTDEQRYHYNMKKGFFQDEKDPEHAIKVGDLYANLELMDRQALEHGVDDNIASLFHESGFRIQESWLKRDKQEAEAHEIVDSIMELI